MKLKAITLAMLNVWAVSSVLTAQNAHAETIGLTSKESDVLGSVTVSASPINDHERFDVPSQIDSFSGAEKAQNESGSLGKMLESVPGVNNMATGTQSGKPVIRGLTGNRVKVLSNGHATDYQAYGVRHNPNTEPYLAERVEVIRGPQGVLYGSEAMGGVVNVIQAPIPYGAGAKGEIASEWNTVNREHLLGAKVGVGSDRFGLTVGISEREGDNFNVPKGASSQGATPNSALSDKPLFVGEVPFTNFENYSGNIGVGYQDDWGNIELRYTQWNSKQNYLGIEADNPNAPFKAVATGQTLQNDEMQLKAEWFLGDDWILKPSWTRSKNQREASHDEPYENMAVDKGTDHYLDLLVERDDYKFALEHPRLGDFEGEIGFEATEKTQTLRSGHLTPSANVSSRAIYLFEEANYDKWLVQFGARYDWHDVEAVENPHFSEVFNTSNNQRDFKVATGALGATYRWDDNWSVAANLATGFRAPTIFELYAGGTHGGVQAYQLGNPELEAEKSINADLSLRWQTSASQVVATVYQNRIDNYIYLANTGFYRAKEGAPFEGQRVAKNAPGAIDEMQAEQTDAQLRGFELSALQQFNAQWSADVALEIIEGKDRANNRDLPLIPANNLTLNGHYSFADYAKLHNQKLSLGVKWIDSKKSAGDYEPFSQFDTKMPVGTASTDAYAVWNMAYHANVKLDKQDVQLGVKVENLFNKGYVDFLNTYKGYTLNPGRNIQFSARLAF